MQTSTKIHMVRFLEEQKSMLLSDWSGANILSNDDPFREKVPENAVAFFNLLLHTLESDEQDYTELIRELALKIAEERVKANINIGEFVYNVNIGRTTFFRYLSNAELAWEEVQESINLINSFFDQFLYHAVSHYAEAKDKIIEEKTQFIDSTHQDRLTLLGQMTSSFIHEFRNPLTSIQGFIQLLKADYPNMRYLDIISGELEQLNFRISQFLLLSKKELIGKEKVVFELNQLIEEVLNFLYPSILDGKVKVVKELSEDISLQGYADEIRQVFINIIFNAIDVLGHHRKENPTIEIHSYMEDHSFITIDVTNNGPMIPQELQNTIFEPFFTTKKLGTGLGLFVCKEIIEKHKGSLSCRSNPAKTTFSIKLPIAGPKAENERHT
ncbi:histidine kinase N-terminal domain-containing protein [Neobacillus sp. SM06]|uniref:histidine kinase N-terminal domain-containing protein n=1 Tax=Neobacillus sp. SM06 TaxID=3422492 RepID=UPI003D2BAC6C